MTGRAVPAALGWVVLTLVFVDEVHAVVIAGVGGAFDYGPPGAVLAPLLVVAVWWAFASPKASRGSPVVRPVTKTVVLGAATSALWSMGHAGGGARVRLPAFSP